MEERARERVRMEEGGNDSVLRRLSGPGLGLNAGPFLTGSGSRDRKKEGETCQRGGLIGDARLGFFRAQWPVGNPLVGSYSIHADGLSWETPRRPSLPMEVPFPTACWEQAAGC